MLDFNIKGKLNQNVLENMGKLIKVILDRLVFLRPLKVGYLEVDRFSCWVDGLS